MAGLRADPGALVDYARRAEELGFHHLIVPDGVLRQELGHRHEVLGLLAYVAAKAERIELVPSVVIARSRRTALSGGPAGGADPGATPPLDRGGRRLSGPLAHDRRLPARPQT